MNIHVKTIQLIINGSVILNITPKLISVNRKLQVTVQIIYSKNFLKLIIFNRDNTIIVTCHVVGTLINAAVEGLYPRQAPIQKLLALLMVSKRYLSFFEIQWNLSFANTICVLVTQVVYDKCS